MTPPAPSHPPRPPRPAAPASDPPSAGPTMNIGLLAVSDRASAGEYADRAIPAMRQWLQNALASPWREISQIVPDEPAAIRAALLNLADAQQCSLILTSGGTGPAARDVTPEVTLALPGAREMPGFGEEMRRASLRVVPTAILSRQTAVVRRRALVINLPGQPKAVAETLQAVFAAVPYCLDLVGAPGLETHPEVVAAFRPASAKAKQPARDN